MAENDCFHQRLPYEVESLEVELPRGLRTHASRAVAGRLRNATTTTKKYSVTVEPYARAKKAKEMLRAASRPVSQLDLYDQQSQQQGPDGLCDPMIEAALEDRSCFRRDRVRRFEVGRRFPVLVSPRLAPSWQVRQPAPQTERSPVGGLALSGQALAFSDEEPLTLPSASPRETVQSLASPRETVQSLTSPRETVHKVPGGDVLSLQRQKKNKSKERLELPTISMTVKKQTKKEVSVSDWKVCGTAQVTGLISDRKPVLYSEPYDEPRTTGSDEATDQRSRVVASARDTLVPIRHVLRDVQASCDTDREDLQFEIAQNRERGLLHCEALKERYEFQRNAFQRERERKGCESPFEVARRKQHARNRETRMKQMGMGSQAPADANQSGELAARFSLGFSKFRGIN